MRTNKTKGTKNRSLIKAATKENLYCYVNNDSSLFEIEHFVAAGLPVIVDYIEPSNDDPHYAIVVGFDEDNVVLNDPWNGADFRISKEDFLHRWHDHRDIHEKWILVISPEDFGVGKQYLPKTKKPKRAKLEKRR